MALSETSLSSPVLWTHGWAFTPQAVPAGRNPGEPTGATQGLCAHSSGGAGRGQQCHKGGSKDTEGNAVHSQSRQLQGGSELGTQNAFPGSIQTAQRKADSTKHEKKITALHTSGAGLILRPVPSVPWGTSPAMQNKREKIPQVTQETALSSWIFCPSCRDRSSSHLLETRLLSCGCSKAQELCSVCSHQW